VVSRKSLEVTLERLVRWRTSYSRQCNGVPDLGRGDRECTTVISRG